MKEEEEEMVQKALTRDLNCNPGNLEWGQKRPSPSSEEEDPQIILPPAKRPAYPPSVRPQETYTSAAHLHSFNQPVSSSSMNHTGQNTPLQHDQGHIKSTTPSLHDPHDYPEENHAVNSSRNLRPNCQASHDSMETDDKTQITVQQEAESETLEDKPNQQMATSNACIQMGCLCGCGGDAVHCLRPNRPASPNTYWENFCAPNFAYILEKRLEAVAKNLEPSKRIWWREEFGGCAPDREPFDFEILTRRGDDKESVLRTSPPHFDEYADVLKSINNNRFRSPRKRQCSSTPLHYLDKATNALPKEYVHGCKHASKSLPVYGFGKRSVEETPHYCANSTSRHSSTQSFIRHPNTRSLRNSTCYIPGRLRLSNSPDWSQRISSSTIRKSPTTEKFEVFRQKWEATVGVTSACNTGECSAKKRRTYADDPRRSIFRGSTVAPKFKPLKSPTHYVPDRLPPLRLPEFSIKHSPIHKIKETTAKEHEELRRSALRKLEILRLERHRRLGIPLKLNRQLSTEEYSQKSDNVGDVPSNIAIQEKGPISEGLHQSLYQRIAAMKARRNGRFGIAIHRSEVTAADILPSTALMDQVNEIPSNMQFMKDESMIDKTQEQKRTLLEKIEAMRLRRNSRHGTALYRHDDMTANISVPASQVNGVEEFPQDFQILRNEHTVDEIQQREQPFE